MFREDHESESTLFMSHSITSYVSQRLTHDWMNTGPDYDPEPAPVLVT